MNKFSWYDATTIEEALEQVSATASDLIQPNAPAQAAVLKSGGIDLLDLIKEGLAKPTKIVNIRNIKGLDEISMDSKTGLRIGANATLTQIEINEVIKNNYFALHQAVAHAATPQLRNVATLGGNLAQRTRCWYFRSIHHECVRKGSGTCYARIGEHAYHSVMKNDLCASVHASSVATALLAFGAKLEVTDKRGKKEISLKDFFVLPEVDSTRENILKPDQIITAIILPPPGAGLKSYYIKQGERESHDWALADVAVVLEMAGKVCKSATVALGAAAPVPILSEEASRALTGKPISEKTAKAAADESMKKATPLSKNAYKIPLFRAIIKRAILKAV
jgi:xanthine dehydrogenase YagS FAD-binding subunit